MTLRQACFDQRFEELRAFVEIAGEANPGLVAKAEKAVFELEPIARCGNVAALREPGLPPSGAKDQIAATMKQLADGKAQLIAGRYLPALTATQKAYDLAKQIGWAPIEAEALWIRGSALLAVGNFADGKQAYMDTAWLGLLGHRDEVAADGALSAALIAASSDQNPAAAKVWLALGSTLAKRNGMDRRLEWRIYQIEGVVRSEDGDLNGAVEAHRKAFELAQREFGKDAVAVFGDEVDYASTLAKAFRFREAIPHFEHAIELRTSMVGPDHGDIATMESNLGFAYRALHETARAKAVLEHALASRERDFGKTSPLLVPTLDNLTDVQRDSGDLAAALATIERAQKLAEVMPGKEHPAWHQVATDHAEILVLLGRYADARALLGETLALEDGAHSAILPATLRERAELALAERAWGDARTFAERSVASYEALGGKDNPELWRPLADLGRAQLELGKRDLARISIERALAIAERIALPAQDQGPIRALAEQLRP